MWQQVERLSIQTQIQQDLRVVHVVREVSRRREVAERHHLFGAVDDHCLIDVGPPRLWLLLKEENIKTKNETQCNFASI